MQQAFHRRCRQTAIERNFWGAKFNQHCQRLPRAAAARGEVVWEGEGRVGGAETWPRFKDISLYDYYRFGIIPKISARSQTKRTTRTAARQ